MALPRMDEVFGKHTVSNLHTAAKGVSQQVARTGQFHSQTTRMGEPEAQTRTDDLKLWKRR